VDLVLLRHKIHAALALADAEAFLDPQDPEPDSTALLGAVARNKGDVPVENVSVEFYSGNPQSGGSLIGQATAPGPLMPSDSALVQTQWQVPDVNSAVMIYAVADPAYAVQDADRSNNTAITTVLLPDLTVPVMFSGRISPAVRTITARVKNDGSSSATGVHFTFRLGSPAGEPLASFHIPFLASRAYQDVTFSWDTASESFDTDEVAVYAIVDINDEIAEINEQNNTAFAQVTVASISDFNNDGTTDELDLAVLVSEWLESGDPASDIWPEGGDGTADFFDYAELALRWYEEGP
jgi:subtilase family serine protease